MKAKQQTMIKKCGGISDTTDRMRKKEIRESGQKPGGASFQKGRSQRYLQPNPTLGGRERDAERKVGQRGSKLTASTRKNSRGRDPL